MLSNAYFLQNFRFDTAENEPAEDLPGPVERAGLRSAPRVLEGRPVPGAGAGVGRGARKP